MSGLRAARQLTRRRRRLEEMLTKLVIHPMLIVAAAVGLAACGVVAAPVRATSAAVKVVPVAGDVVAAPLDATAYVID